MAIHGSTASHVYPNDTARSKKDTSAKAFEENLEPVSILSTIDSTFYKTWDDSLHITKQRFHDKRILILVSKVKSKQVTDLLLQLNSNLIKEDSFKEAFEVSILYIEKKYESLDFRYWLNLQ